MRSRSALSSHATRDESRFCSAIPRYLMMALIATASALGAYRFTSADQSCDMASSRLRKQFGRRVSPPPDRDLHALRFHALVAFAPILRPLLTRLDFAGGFRFTPLLAASALTLDHRLTSRLALGFARGFRGCHRRGCGRGRGFRHAILHVVFFLQTFLLVLGHFAPLLAAGLGVLRRSRRRNRKGEPDRCRRTYCNEKTSFHLATSLLAQT